MKARTTALQLQSLTVVVERTRVFLNIEPDDAYIVEVHNLGGRMKCRGAIGAFYGGILGIFCGFVLSFMTNLGSLPIYDMLSYWAAMCLTGAVVAGGLSSLCVRLLQLKSSYKRSDLHRGKNVRRMNSPWGKVQDAIYVRA